MRIISGRWKGHSLVSFQADHIRPTTDRVKETLFNMLQSEVPGARVLDLFCGTGNLGLESLSRGAAHTMFVEKNPKSLDITKANITKLKVPEAEFAVRSMDALQYLRGYEGAPYDLIFADPPFTEALAHSVMSEASDSQAFGENTIMAIESRRRERLEEEYKRLVRVDQREFGDKILSFFRQRPEEAT